jgi:hypothetical protein
VDLRGLKTKYKLGLVFWSVVVLFVKLFFILFVEFNYLLDLGLYEFLSERYGPEELGSQKKIKTRDFKSLDF